MTFWKDKVTLQKVGVTSWKDRNLTNMDSTRKEKCPQGVCSGEGEYITCTQLQRVIAAENSTACKGYESTRHAGVKQHNSPTGECKSNDGLMNQEYPHSIQEPITERQCPGDIPSKLRIKWPKGNQIATWKI